MITQTDHSLSDYKVIFINNFVTKLQPMNFNNQNLRSIYHFISIHYFYVQKAGITISDSAQFSKTKAYIKEVKLLSLLT